MKGLPDNSIDSIVTDPPYELGFMGKKWDSTGIAYNVELWQEVLRVLKPGGHLLAFGGTRTYHRMACAIEDAGFEIRDCIQYLYGSGFPKSMDISKAIDKKAGAERKVIGQLKRNDRVLPSGQGGYHGRLHEQYQEKGRELIKLDITAPSTDEAKQWDGWGTCLKPANEPIVVARKPISEKTIAENVMKWGTGGLNIDGCRIESNNMPKGCNGTGFASIMKTNVEQGYRPLDYYEEQDGFKYTPSELGRFPANVILDEEAGKLLDEQSGISKSSKGITTSSPTALGQSSGWNSYNNRPVEFVNYGDSGGASRFFYCAKASKKERGEGNNHPTVKPISLMRYLVRLITPPNGIVLDPFTGSGTTLIASKLEGFSFVGIEQAEEYCEIAKARLEHWQMEEPQEDERQQTLFGGDNY
jgi:site-specific DNA-methyltransferase (adenine-specific)